MTKKKLAEKLRELGDARDYDGQAKAFLDETDAKLSVKFSGLTPNWAGGKSALWIFRIERNGREYIGEFHESRADYEARIDKFGRAKTAYLNLYGRGEELAALAAEKLLADCGEYAPAGIGGRPGCYSILACLDGVSPENRFGDIDGMAEELGYGKPSEALKVWGAIKKEADGLQRLFNNGEIEALNEIA